LDKLHVTINARAAVRDEIGGVERVARAMTAELPRVAPGRYRVVRPPRALARRAGHLWEQAVLPLRARGSALLYSPANAAPLASAGNVIVVHDAAAFRHPDWYSRAFVVYQQRVLPLLARRARLVITVSEFSRGELAEVLGIVPDRIAVVPNGVDARFTPAVDPAPARAAHGLERPYVLAVGSRIGRKNLAALEPAASRLASEGVELVAAGSGRGYMRAERARPARSLGYVPDEHLPGLYAGALALAMPSLYEGFGLPCLEAMACGTPVVASDRGALPGTCGDAALLADPGDPEVFADALLRAVADEAERERLSVAGLERARRFTWRRAAETTDALISDLLR
jgi:glycosyltransferase involved in cell wall biosynthesis